MESKPNENIINDLYSKYYSYPSAMRGEFIPSRDNRFLQIFDDQIMPLLSKKKKRILEIGCFDGYILSKLKVKGFEVFGCDPSEGADIAGQYGLTNVKRSLFSKNLFNGKKFDIIILRHIIEHCENPIDFIAEIKQILEIDGILIIETPDAESYLKNGLLEVFSHQHLQYFSSASISETAKKVDMECIKVIIDNNNIISVFNCVSGANKIFSKINNSLLSEFKINISKNKEFIRRFIENSETEGRQLTVWGAGGFCALLINHYADNSKKNIKYIFDSDKKKYGLKFMEVDAVISEPYGDLKDFNSNIIVASMYSDEILIKIKNLKFQGKILLLHPTVKIENI